MYEAKKLKQNKAKIALKQRKANSQKLEQKANKQKTNTAKKATHQKKKNEKNEKPKNTSQGSADRERGVYCGCSVLRGVGGVAKSCKNFKHFDCKFLYFKKVHTNPIIESINGDKCRSVPVIVLPCECFRVYLCVCVSVRWLTAANCSTQNGSQRKAQ